MQSRIQQWLSGLGLLLCLTGQLSAQSGSVSGTIYDTDGSTTLPGASVYLKSNPSVGVASDIDGAFLMTNVPVGEQVIMISYTGYNTQEIPLDVRQGETSEVEVSMESTAYSGETVIVTAQALGQAKAINQQLNSDAIANFVSADKIKELPDVNAAEAISRLPGVAINRSGGEGSKVVVRGLDPKFTAISINGVRLPSTSGTDRSVDLSLISPELLSGIELFKSPTADMDGDALGGSINLNIIKAPKERKASVKVLGGYNDISGTWQDYKATASLAQRVLKGKLGITATANVERFNRSGENISQSWGDDSGIILDTALNIFAQEGNALRYREIQEIRKRQNGSLGIDFELGKKTDVTVLGIYSRTSRNQFNQTESYNINANRVDYFGEIRESAIELYSGSVSTRHQLGNLKLEWGAAYSEVAGETPYNVQVDFRNETNPVFLPGVNDARTNPSSFYSFLTPDPTADYLQAASSARSGNSEAITSGYLNFELPFQLTDNIRATFKTGGKVTAIDKDRDFEESVGRLFYLLRNTTFAEFVEEGAPALGRDATGQFYYGMSNFLRDGEVEFTQADGNRVNLLSNIDPDKIRRFNEIYEESLLRPFRYSEVNNYNLQENVYAGYVQLKLNIGKKLTAIPGFRMEHSDNTYSGIFANLAGDFGESGTVRPESQSVTYTIPLPHLHLKYKPYEWLDFRASYSTTLARPDYEYVVPATLINRNNDVVINQGNPNLAASVSTNYDFFVTAFSGKWGLLSGGVFYKDIQDAFYPFIIGLNNDSLVNAFNLGDTGGRLVGAQLTTYSNSPASVVKGFEVELQTNLNFLPEPFNGLVANFNYTRLESETTINSFREVTSFGGGFPPTIMTEVFPLQREVALVGQARDILNASLGYDFKRSFSARVSTSFQGDKISGYSAGSTKDRFNRGFWRVDAALKKKFKNGLSLFLNLNNLSSQQDINFYTSLARDLSNRDFVTSVTSYGATATFGAEYKFQ